MSFSCCACDPLPKGWIASGDAFYRWLVSGGIAYAANYTGGYPYGFYLFDGSFNPVFDASVESADTYTFACGGWQLQFHCL